MRAYTWTDQKTEDELLATLPETDVRQQITKLYRANLIKAVITERWATTEFSEAILVRLGIAKVVAKSLLAEQRIPDLDFRFLDACIEAKDNWDIDWSKQETALLKILSIVLVRLRDRSSEAEINTLRLMYAFIVGLDPDVQRLGERTFCKLVIDRRQKTSEDKELENRWSTFYPKCARAIGDVYQSNQFLLHGNLPDDSEKELTYSLTWARVLSALFTRFADDGLKAAFWAREDVTSEVWSSLVNWVKDVDERSVQFLSLSGKFVQKVDVAENKLELLKTMLSEILHQRSEQTVLPSPPLFLTWQQEELSGSDDAIQMLMHIQSRMKAGGYSDASEIEKTKMQKLLDDLVAGLETQSKTSQTTLDDEIDNTISLSLYEDLKIACQQVFNRYQQSTHATWEDLQQEILLRFGRWLPQYENAVNRQSVFYRIAVNLLIDAQRRERAARRRSEESQLNQGEWESIPDTRTSIEDHVFLKECRNQLSEEDQVLFDEHFIQGRALREIAVRHNLSSKTISRRWAHIIEILSPIVSNDKRVTEIPKDESKVSNLLLFDIRVRSGDLAA